MQRKHKEFLFLLHHNHDSLTGVHTPLHKLTEQVCMQLALSLWRYCNVTVLGLCLVLLVSDVHYQFPYSLNWMSWRRWVISQSQSLTTTPWSPLSPPTVLVTKRTEPQKFIVTCRVISTLRVFTWCYIMIFLHL